MIVAGIVCPKCGDVIYSRCTRDCHHCSCGAVAVDGGFIHLKISFNPADGVPQHKSVDIGDISRAELYDDWNENVDKYGLIKGER